MNIIVFFLIAAAGILGYTCGGYDARRQTSRLRQWLESIRDTATDERISRDTVRQLAVEALNGKTFVQHG